MSNINIENALATILSHTMHAFIKYGQSHGTELDVYLLN